MEVKMIAAVNARGGVGLNGQIPWRCWADLAHFRALTMGGALIVGRKTAESLPPLDGRHIITLSRSTEGEGVCFCMSDALLYAARLGVEHVWIAGGVEVWQRGAQYASELYLSRIPDTTDCDTMFPWEILDGLQLSSLSERPTFTVAKYINPKPRPHRRRVP